MTLENKCKHLNCLVDHKGKPCNCEMEKHCSECKKPTPETLVREERERLEKIDNKIKNLKKEALEEFRIELKKTYKGILPDELLEKGNAWFEQFILDYIDKANKCTINEFLNGERCFTCGDKKEPATLSDTCFKCFENN